MRVVCIAFRYSLDFSATIIVAMNQARTVNFVRIPIIKVENLCWLMFTNCVVNRVNQNVFRLFPFRSRRARDWDLIYAPFIARRASFIRRSVPSTSFPTLSLRRNINSRDNHRQCAMNWEARKKKVLTDGTTTNRQLVGKGRVRRHVVVVCNK